MNTKNLISALSSLADLLAEKNNYNNLKIERFRLESVCIKDGVKLADIKRYEELKDHLGEEIRASESELIRKRNEVNRLFYDF